MLGLDAMFLAHLPAGYLLTRALRRRTPAGAAPAWLGLAASVLPDVDLLWFYLVDHRQHVHHAYWTHLPVFWIAVGLVWLGAAGLSRSPRLLAAWALVLPNALLHLILDTVSGGIRWLEPFSSANVVLAYVPARHGWWVANFLLHWSFLIEAAILAAALAVLLRRPQPEAV